MPAGDGTGPMGMGPMTGRQAGYCAGYPVPGFMNPIPGRGFWGRGRGGGWGRRNRFYATGMTGWQQAAMGWPAWVGPGSYPGPYAAPGTIPPVMPSTSSGQWPYAAPYAAPFAPTMTREQELDALKGQAEYFEDALEGIRKRLEELQAEASGKGE